MNEYNYRNRRTKLLWTVGLHQCLHCGHIGSRGNLLEFHHCNGNSKRHGIGGRQGLIQLEQDWFEWTHFKTPENALIVLCHNCHCKVHSLEQQQEEIEDENLFLELTRYRFCCNQSFQCIYKKCVDCPDYRTANKDLII